MCVLCQTAVRIYSKFVRSVERERDTRRNATSCLVILARYILNGKHVSSASAGVCVNGCSLMLGIMCYMLRVEPESTLVFTIMAITFFGGKSF